MKSLVVLGGGTHCPVVIEAAELAGFRVHGVLDPALRPGNRIAAIPVLGGDSWLDEEQAADFVYHIGLTEPRLRHRLRLLLEERSLPAVSVIHPSAVIARSARIEAGCYLGPGSIVNPGAILEQGVVLNSRALIEHDCIVSSDSHVAPSATLAGGVQCGARVFVGAGSIILPNLRIGEGAVIGAGAVVLDTVSKGTTVVGNPAKPIRNGS